MEETARTSEIREFLEVFDYRRFLIAYCPEMGYTFKVRAVDRWNARNDDVTVYWNKHPVLSFGQVLMNKGFLRFSQS